MNEKDHRPSHNVCDVIPGVRRASYESNGHDQPLLAGAENGLFPEMSYRDAKLIVKFWSKYTRSVLYLVFGAIAILAIGLVSLAAANLTTIKRPTATHLPVSMDENAWLGCGSTPQEARALGCVFDVMLSSWVQARCHDRDHMEAQMLKVQFPWFRDRNMTEPVLEEEVRLGEYGILYLYQNFHYEHCMYMWRLQIRAWRGGLPIDSGSWDMGHIEHCAQWMLNPKLHYPRNFTKVHLGFFRCGSPYVPKIQ